MNKTPPTNIVSTVVTWAMNQGPSTILLLLGAWAVFKLIPASLDKIEAGYKANADQLEKSTLANKETTDAMLRVIQDMSLRNAERDRQQDLWSQRIGRQAQRIESALPAE